jgi:hypothetical protein
MATDPKEIIEAILDGISATIDDDITAASILVHYDGGNDTWFELFDTDDYDVVIELKEGRYGGTRFIQDVPVYHDNGYTISIVTTDKYDSTPTLIATGSEMQWKIREDMNNDIETFAQGTEYTINIRSGGMQSTRVAQRYMYVTTYEFLFQETSTR